MSEQGVVLEAAGQTDVGLKRKKNEDSFKYLTPSKHSEQGALFVVADGMGSFGGGDLASQTAVTEIIQDYYKVMSGDAAAGLQAALETANEAVRQRANEINLPRIGAAAAGVVILPSNEALVFNVGDCRVYRARRSAIDQLSHDQSVLQLQRDAGVLSEEASEHRRNVNITAFIGQPMPLKANYQRTQVMPDDTFIICSDGLWDLVEPYEILKIVRQSSPKTACRKLIEMALARGAHDNVTVIVIRAKAGNRTILLAGASMAFLLALGAGIIILVYGGGKDDKPDTSAAAPPTTTAVAVLSSETSAPTAHAVINVITTLATATPSLTSTLIPPTATPTLTRTATLTRTVAPSATITNTLQPTSTATQTLTLAPKPTNSLTPTLPPTLTRTAPATSIQPPTVTLNPTVVTFTPSPVPSSTPTLTPGEQMLILAADEGVILAGESTLYILPANPSDTVQTVALPSHTQVQLVDDEVRPSPLNPNETLLHVGVLDSDQEGWISRQTLEAADAITPHAIVNDVYSQGVNVRRGDGVAYDVITVLRPGSWMRIIGISSERSGWYLVEVSTGRQGWIAPNVVTIIGDISDLPVVVPPPSPTPTETPTPEITETPTP